MNIEQQLFLDLAKLLEVEIKTQTELDGSLTIIAQDKIDLNKAYKSMLRPQIENKMNIVKHLSLKSSKGVDGLKKWYMIDEYFKQKRELFDLEVEYATCDNYISNYSQHIEYGMVQKKIELEKANEELPLLIEQAEQYLKLQENIFEFKINAILIGCVFRYKEDLTQMSDDAIIQFHKDMIEYVSFLNKDKE